MTKDEVLREPARDAINYIVKVQNGDSGGWRYEPNQQGEPGFHQNDQGGQLPIEPGSGNGNSNDQGNDSPGGKNPNNSQGGNGSGSDK